MSRATLLIKQAAITLETKPIVRKRGSQRQSKGAVALEGLPICRAVSDAAKIDGLSFPR